MTQIAPQMKVNDELGSFGISRMRHFIMILICGVCFGCAPRSITPRHADGHAGDWSPDERKAIEIARSTLSTNAGFRADRVSYQVGNEGSNWWVTVWSEPKKPGGFCTLEITHDGKVARIIPGL